MKLEHVAIWTENLEELKNFYTSFMGGKANEKYINTQRHFQSYFISFPSGARLEIMTHPDVPDNKNDKIFTQFKGLIHIAFEVETMLEVEEKAKQFKANGFKILKGPRKTGDGYYEFETHDPDNNRLEITTKYVES